MAQTPDKIVDATGLKCPMPLLRCKSALRLLTSGQLLELLSNDPQTPDDIRRFIEISGHELVESWSADGVVHCLVRRA
ncbi:MAG: sulfurtransferase TusA family protein [Gammaproteobacteria bacterium]|nr:sulfurtransferase TusA family protein [Gammaproteobacteria bacterium]